MQNEEKRAHLAIWVFFVKVNMPGMPGMWLQCARNVVTICPECGYNMPGMWLHPGHIHSSMISFEYAVILKLNFHCIQN